MRSSDRFASRGPGRSLVPLIVAALVFLSCQRQPAVVEVWDCSDERLPCRPLEISHTLGECRAWYLGMDPDLIDCEATRDGLDEVLFIADPANHVRAPLSEQIYDIEAWSYGLEYPWDLEFLPDGSMLVTQRPGQLIHIREGRARRVAHLEVGWEHNYEGLLGLAVDPDFDSNRFVYLFYTYEVADPDRPPGHELLSNRISRFRFDGERLADESVLLDPVPGAPMRNGGRLEFGPDGKLYASVGDAHDHLTVGDPDFLNGKILRLEPDGSIPEDNPFPGSTVYSLGHSNPQGLAWDGRTGEMFASEHGEWRYDEINRIVAGGDYGWPARQCDEPFLEGFPVEDAHGPVRCFRDWTLAPSGMAFVDEPGHPWEGSLFVTGLRGNHLHRLTFDERGEVATSEVFYVTSRHVDRMSRRLRDVEFHDGALYVVGDSTGIARLTPSELSP